jgi:hypothetical protein
MSVDSKLFVTCGKDKYIEVVNAVISQLNGWVRKKLDDNWIAKPSVTSRMHFLWNKDCKAELFTNGTNITAHNLDMISVNFGCGELRSLSIFGDCSSDYEETCEGYKIIYILVREVGHV